MKSWFKLRSPISTFSAVLLGLACIALCFGLWWFVTRGEKVEERIVSPISLPSPAETFGNLKSLVVERDLVKNIFITLRRLVLGFGFAAAVGITLGVLAGCFPSIHAFLAPLILFGRNIPIAALLGLMYVFFGIREPQKVFFIFFACVPFVVSDVVTNIDRMSTPRIRWVHVGGISSQKY
jgi:NitT/TauT family transport system permease protein